MRNSLLGALAAAVVLLAGCASAGGDGPQVAGAEDDDGRYGAVLTEPYDVPDVELVDTDGAPYSLASSTDKPLTLVFFGYTNCPDICTIVMSTVASAVNQLDDDDRDQVDVVFVTTDPARDDEQAIRDYLDRFDPEFIGVTGAFGDIETVAQPLGIDFSKGKKLSTGGYEVDHSTPVIGIDAEDQAPIVWTQGTSAAQFAADIHQQLAEG